MLEPVAFEKSLDSYLESQSSEEIRALVLRSIKQLDGAHRAQLALFLGLDVTGDPITEVGGSAIDEQELRTFIASCALLRERFGAFLRDNPRAIRALGKNVSNRILGPSEYTPVAFFRRLPPKAAAAMVLALIVTFVPLAAQYEHQRGMSAGPYDLSGAPPVAAVARPLVHHPARTADSHPVRAHAVLASAPLPIQRQIAMHVRVAHRTHVQRMRDSRVASRSRTHSVHHTYVANNWKFDRRFNPYFNRAAWHVRFVANRQPRMHSNAPAPLPTGFEGRATLIVTSYLNAVIAGDTPSALHHLGLPATAPQSNLSESPIITRDSRAHVVSVDAQPDGRAKVEVDIYGRAGEYFEVFYVAHDGPAVRIMDRYYIPVNRTAEERAARSLAKDGH